MRVNYVRDVISEVQLANRVDRVLDAEERRQARLRGDVIDEDLYETSFDRANRALLRERGLLPGRTTGAAATGGDGRAAVVADGADRRVVVDLRAADAISRERALAGGYLEGDPRPTDKDKPADGKTGALDLRDPHSVRLGQ